MNQLPAEPPLPQVAKFGVIGLLATAVNSGVYALGTERLLLLPLLANVAGFCCAFSLSFLGHYHWTFAAQTGTPGALRSSAAKFLATALLGLASNSFIIWLLVQRLALPASSAQIGILFVTPLLTFVCSKYWAFAPGRGPG